MGIRRRRKKLTSLISNMDKRIRTVEFKKTAYGVTSTTEEVSSNEEVGGNEPAGSVYSPTLPNPWTRVQRAYFHPSNVVAGDRFEVLMYNTNGIESVSGSSAEKGDFVSISALGRSAAPIVTVGRTYFKNTNPSNPYYTCRAHGTPSWSLSSTNTRESLKFNGNQVYVPLPISGDVFGTVTHTYLFSHGSSITANGPRYSLATRALIASHSATTTTATLTISGTSHHYTADDIIDVNDLPEAYRGVDGLFKVKSVTSTTISYDFDTPLSAAISSATASSGTYIYSVAQKYVRVGSTWFDTANDNKVYYWNGIRYQVGQVAGLSNDGSAPSPPTNLTLATSGYTRPDGSSRSRVDVSWTAPTTSANGNTLDDLLGYKIRISESGYENWRDTRDLIGPDNSETITGLDPDKTYYFRVTAYDSFGNESTGLDGNIVTGLAALSVTTPSAPIIPTPRLGLVTVNWDGRDSAGAIVPPDLIKYLEVHASTTSGFTPSEATLKGKIYRASDPCQVVGLTYNTTYYFKFIAIDTSDNATSASTQTSVIVKPLVDTDLIAAQVNAPLTAWPFANGAVTSGALASGAISASNMFASNVIVQSAIAANAIGADQLAAGSIVAGKLAANSIAAGNIQALAINAGHIASNTITADQINAGSVAAVTVTASTVTGTVMSGSKTIQLYDPSVAYNAKIGYQAAGSYQDVSYGLYNGSSIIAWFGLWGGGAVELGTNFTENYIDMYSDNTMNINSSGTGGVNFIGNVSVNGTRFYSYGRIVGYSGSDTAAVIIYDGYGGTEVFRVNTLNRRITVTGDIQYTGTISDISSERFKTNIQPYSTNYSILDIPIVNYQYDFAKIDPTRDDIGEVMLGTIAERAVEVGAGDIVSYDKDGLPHGVDYTLVGLMLVPIVKELREELQILKDRIK